MEIKNVNGINILHFESVDSTNNVAMQYELKRHLLTFVSDTQTSGRGRIGRQFYSYSGGLYMSVVVEPELIKIPYHICTPAAALSVKQSFNNLGIDNVRIKWVNDLLIDEKKICGILTECKTVDNKVERIVVGIGINFSNTNVLFPEEIKNKAGVVKCNADKLQFASDIVKNLSCYLQGDAATVVKEYSKNLAFIEKKVLLTDYANNNAKIEGKILGVNDDCFLKIEMPDKTVKLLSSGEII